MSPSGPSKIAAADLNNIVLIAAVLTLGNLAICIHGSSRLYLFQQSLCIQHFRATDPSKVHAGQAGIDESLCKIDQVQRPLSVIEGIDGFLGILPALLVLPAYQRLLALVGLRRILTFSLFLSALIPLFAALFFKARAPWTVHAILLVFFFNLVGGGGLVRIVISITCVAAICPPDRLAEAYNYITGLLLVASVAASAIGSLLLSTHVYALNSISLVCFAVAIVGATYLPELGVNEGQASHDNVSLGPINLDSTGPTPTYLPPSSKSTPSHYTRGQIFHTLITSWRSSLYSILTLFSVPFNTRTALAVFMISVFATASEILLPQYMSLNLHWPLAVVNAALAVKAAVSAGLLFLLPTLRKCILAPWLGNSPQRIDMFISQGSLVVYAAGMAAMGFSSLPAALFVLVMCLYTCGMGLSDSLVAYATVTLLPPPEGLTVPELYVRTGLINTIAGLAGAPLWSKLYNVALGSQWLPNGIPFWICAILLSIAFGVLRTLSSYSGHSARYTQVPTG